MGGGGRGRRGGPSGGPKGTVPSDEPPDWPMATPRHPFPYPPQGYILPPQLRQHEAQRPSLKVGEHAEHEGHGDAVPDGKAEQVAFLPDHVGRGRGDGQGLRRNHLRGDAAGSVGGYGKFGRHAHRRGGILLHAAEQGARGGVRTGQEHAEPTEQRREEREQAARVREGQAKRGAHAGIVHQIGEAEDHGDGHDREGQLAQRAHEAGDGLAETVVRHHGHGDEAGKHDGGAAGGQPVKREHRAVNAVLRHDGRGLHHFAVQAGPAEAEVRAGDGVQNVLELRQAPEEHEDRQHDVGAPRTEHHRSGIAGAAEVGFGLALEPERARGLPDLEQQHEAHDGGDGRADVGQGRAVVVGEQELRPGEAHAAHDDGGQHFHAALEAAHGHADPERHDEGEDGELTARDGAHGHLIKAGYGGRHDEWHADGAEGDGCGIGGERDARAPQRGEAEPHQHGGGNGHRRAEARRPFDEATEGISDEQRLQAAVIGEPGQRVLDDLEFAGLHGHVVHPHRRDHDPDDGEQPEGGAVERGTDRQGNRHIPHRHRDDQRTDEACRRRDVAFGLPDGQHVKKDDERNRREACRSDHAAHRRVLLNPRHMFPL